jgi:hypothetical protein
MAKYEETTGGDEPEISSRVVRDDDVIDVVPLQLTKRKRSSRKKQAQSEAVAE